MGTKAKEIIKKIKEKLFPAFELEESMIDNALTCEDFLTKKVCDKLKAAAEKLKQKAKDVDALVRKVLKEKVKEAKEIAKRVRQKLVDMAKNFKCEDVLPAEVCAKVKELAEKAKVKAEEVKKVLKELIAKGVTKAKEIIKKIKEKLFPAFELDESMIENALTCEDFLKK